MPIKKNVLTACEYEKCAQGLTNELTIWHLPIMTNQLTHLFVLVCHGLVVIHTMMSSLYIEWYSPPTCIAQQLIILLTCNHLRRPWWGAVTFVKYVDKYVKNL